MSYGDQITESEVSDSDSEGKASSAYTKVRVGVAKATTGRKVRVRRRLYAAPTFFATIVAVLFFTGGPQGVQANDVSSFISEGVVENYNSLTVLKEMAPEWDDEYDFFNDLITQMRLTKKSEKKTF